MNKKICAFLLAALMVASLLPAMSMATDVSDAAAFKAAMEAGGDVKLAQDIVLTEGVTVPAGKTVTLDLNGKTVSMTDASGTTSFLIKNNGTLTIQDSGSTGKISFKTNTPSLSNRYASNAVSNYGTLTVKSGLIENTSPSGSACYAIDGYAGSVTNIEGGRMTARSTAVRVFNWSTTPAVMNISGGEIYSKVGFAVNLNTGRDAAVTLDVSGGTIETDDTDYALAIYAYADQGSAKGTEIHISGGTLKGVFGFYGTPEAGNLSVTGGTMDNIYAWTDWEEPFVTGGTIKANPADLEGMLPDDYVVDDQGNITVPAPIYGGPPMNWVKCSAADNGIVKSGPLAASEGATITLYPKAAAGYVLDTVEVLDAEGNAVELNGLKFRVPLGGVTVNATFKPAN